jgi:hypothetical protein
VQLNQEIAVFDRICDIDYRRTSRDLANMALASTQRIAHSGHLAFSTVARAKRSFSVVGDD